MERNEARQWYEQNHRRYQDFMEKVRRLMEELLRSEGIPVHSVTGRLKDRESFVEKCERKGYDRPEQAMDMAGLRVITHTTAEVEQVCALIRREFQIDEANSGDKGAALEVDRVGYLSVHFVAKLSAPRLELPEYRRFDRLCCEIQVRSLLQHAWAEIEHDRSYKFAGVLPAELRRRFHLVAATLELMDREFRSLSEAIDDYALHVQKEAKKGNLDLSIDSTSLLQYLHQRFPHTEGASPERTYARNSEKLISELSAFGISTLAQVEALLQNNRAFVDECCSRGTWTYVGMLRLTMVQADPGRYFTVAWQGHWGRLSVESMELLQRHGTSLSRLEQYLRIECRSNGEYLLRPKDQMASAPSNASRAPNL